MKRRVLQREVRLRSFTVVFVNFLSMKVTSILLLIVAVFGTAAAVKLSVSQTAHMRVEEFLEALQPFVSHEIDAKAAWPWPEDSYFPESTESESVAFLEESPAPSATGSTGSASGTGATGEDDETGASDETGAASTGATGATASTGATGATGATATTGSTGATGDEEPPKPKEAKDATVFFDMSVSGVTKEQVLSEKGSAAFTGAIAKAAKVPASSVSITSAEPHDDTDPMAKAHAAAKAAADHKAKKLAENAAVGNVEQKVKAVEGAQVAKGAKKTAIGFIEVSAGSLDIKFTVGGMAPSEAGAIAQDVSSFIDNDGDDGFAQTVQKAGLPVKAVKLNRLPVVEGGKPKAGCAKEVLKHLDAMKADKTPETEIPARMRSFCHSTFNARKAVLPASLSPAVIQRTCERAFTIFNRRPVGKRQEAAVEESRLYCYEMRHFFEYLIKKNGVTDMKHGLATSVSEVNRATPGQGATACCVPHQSNGCFDNKPEKNIQECVCKGGVHSHHPSKHDKFCCDTEWDLTCAENVEWYGCAACPQPEFLFRR